MINTCQSCKKAPVEIEEATDESKERYKVCRNCHHRLVTHSLRPREWYNLSSIHGWWEPLLDDERYTEDGIAIQPEEKVVAPELFPCPKFEEVADSTEQLLDFYFASRGRDEDIESAMKRFPPEDLISAFSHRIRSTENYVIIGNIFRLCSKTLVTEGAVFVRDNWAWYARKVFRDIALAAAKCLPFEEAYAKVTDFLSQLDANERRGWSFVLRLFETSRNLDWIEKNVQTPIDIAWGGLAAVSEFDWDRAKKWLSGGRPLSLVALDALGICLVSMLRNEEKKPKLLNPPDKAEFISTLEDYLKKDNVPRVRRQIPHLKHYAKYLGDTPQ